MRFRGRKGRSHPSGSDESISGLLEKRARALRKRALKRVGSSDPRSSVEREIGFVIEQIDRLREVQKGQLAEIRRWEYEAERSMDRPGADLPGVAETRMRLEAKRRKLLLTYERDMSRLTERLFTLLNQHSYLDTAPGHDHDGDRRGPRKT